MLLGFFLTIVMIKLAEQAFLSSNSITIISSWSKEFELAFSQPAITGTLPSYLRKMKLRSAMAHSVAQLWLLHQ
jgi:Na+/H+-dicarboxylate symporter